MKYKLFINDTYAPAKTEECSTMTIESDNTDELVIMLWALAKQSIPEYAGCWLPGALEILDNQGMRNLPVPERFSDQVNAKVENLNRANIEAIVVNALNESYNELGRFGDFGDFIGSVRDAAEHWAQDCYQ